MAEYLASYEPKSPDTHQIHKLFPTFSYGLQADHDKWEQWLDAVEDRSKYQVTQRDVQNAEMFSSFALYTEC